MKELPEIQRLRQGESPLAVFERSDIQESRKAFNELRYRYDFPFWAAKEYPIRDIHNADSEVTLILNSYQYHIIDKFMTRYFKRLSSRYIITKDFGRCGVSTCVQAYILWLQLYRWPKNSQTCGASELNISPLKENLIQYIYLGLSAPAKKRIYNYKIDHSSFFNTFRSPDALRGIDFAYVHLADMGKWYDPKRRYAPRAYAAAYSGVLDNYRTLIVMEGNIMNEKYFHLEDNYNLKKPNTLQLCDYPKICRNPFFLREVVDAHNPACPSPFLLINLSSLPPPTGLWQLDSQF